MTKDEALKLALAAIESEGWCDTEIVITAIKQALAAPVQQPVADRPAPWHHRILKVHPETEPEFWPDHLRLKYMTEELEQYRAAFATPPAAQPAPVQEPVRWSDYEPDGRRYPAVPDAFGTREGEHPQYIQGWNDCRQAMLEVMK
jgi:hypothetical protein